MTEIRQDSPQENVPRTSEGVGDRIETRRIPRVDGVREMIREPLRLLVGRLQAGLGDNLQSVTVVGSSLTEDYQPATSDINTVVVVNQQDMMALNAVASLARPMSRQKVAPPLLMTPSYIERSRDVFGVEFLDFQLAHETILGADPFTSLHIEKKDVRLQCERELKATLVRLRQGYITAAGDRTMIRDILISTGKGLAPLARAMLWLRDVERPKTMEAALRRAGDEFQVDLNAAVAAERWRYERPRLTEAEVRSVFTALLAAVDRLAAIIDELEV